jgi:hypothetical protein
MYIYPRHESIIKIGHAIEMSPESFLSVYKAKQRIDLHNKNHVCYLTKGNVSAYSFGREVLIFNIFSPEIIGLEKIGGLTMINHLRCVTNAEMHIIDTRILKDLINNNDLWSNAYDISLVYLKSYHSRDNKLSSPSAKDTIVQYIKYIWSLEPSQREVTSIYSFILERTHISRSLIHRVVSNFESEGLISVHRGILRDCKLT